VPPLMLATSEHERQVATIFTVYFTHSLLPP
jgi:hypothetical protein